MAADTLAAPVTGRQLRLGPRTRWETAALLAATAALYLWNLDINGWANPFYSAAAQAGADNFTAFFFGSSDPANSISVDKPPLALWFMSLSVKLFGLSPWSILVPQALMGVATVWFVYRITADYCGHRWGLLAGTMMAVTPTAAMIFRFNNPDALLTLIMTASAYVTIRAMRARQVRWLALTGALVGARFLTKQLQVAFIVPAIAVTIVAFGPWPLLTRLRAAGLTAGTALAVAGTWLGAVALTPAAARPFIGGTRSNSFLELTLGYNGLDRLTGAGSARAAMPGTDGGEPNIPGVLRYLVPEWSSQITWFLPLACAGLIVLVPALRHAHNRSRAEPAFVVLMGLWFLTSAGALSLVSVQTIHPYYFPRTGPRHVLPRCCGAQGSARPTESNLNTGSDRGRRWRKRHRRAVGCPRSPKHLPLAATHPWRRVGHRVGMAHPASTARSPHRTAGAGRPGPHPAVHTSPVERLHRRRSPCRGRSHRGAAHQRDPARRPCRSDPQRSHFSCEILHALRCPPGYDHRGSVAGGQTDSHMGRSGHRLFNGGPLPTREPASCDPSRRLRRHGRRPHARGIRIVRQGWQGGLLHRWSGSTNHRARAWRVCGDPVVGAQYLHVRTYRFDVPLRPQRCKPLIRQGTATARPASAGRAVR